MPGNSIADDCASVVRADYFSKLPARGDFLLRDLPQDFVDPWDEWVQVALEESRKRFAAMLDGNWLKWGWGDRQIMEPDHLVDTVNLGGD